EWADQLAIDHAVAVIRFDAGQKAEAEPALRKVQAERARLAAEEPANPDYQAQLADTLQALRQLLAETDRFEEGTVRLEQALRGRAKLADDHPGTRSFREEHATALLAAADVAWRARRLAHAARWEKSGLDLLEALVQAEPANKTLAARRADAEW